MTNSPWSDHLKITIQCWSRERARQLSDKALKVSIRDHRDIEHFLTEVLTDALLTFNETYNKASEEYVNGIERLLADFRATLPSNPVILGRDPENSKRGE